jgi:hypothetical protein
VPKFDTSFNFGANVRKPKAAGRKKRGKARGKRRKGAAYGS